MIGGFAIGVPTLCNASRLLNGNAMPPLGKLCRKRRRMKGVRHLIGAKERDILLCECQEDVSELVKCCEFSWVGLNQTNMGHRASDALRLTLFRTLLSLLAHLLYASSCFSGDSP